MIKRAAVVATALALVLAAQPAAAKRKVSGQITVFAAASLTESFTAIAKQFEKKYPDVTVRFDFDASSNLAAQIQQGAPADVFASADEVNLQMTIESGDLVGPPVVFAKNRLEIAVEGGNPKKIKRLADLAKPGLVVVLCADAVPCGKYAAEAFTKSGVQVSPASKEENAKAALSKVSLGEADAAVVYATDVKAAKGHVSGVKIPEQQNVLATYPIGLAKRSQGSAAAKAWVRFIDSKEAQRTLQQFGFLLP